MKTLRDFLTAGLALIALSLCFAPSVSAGSAPTPMAVISRNAPAFASSWMFQAPPGNANDDVYEGFDYHSWMSTSVPAWIAYDLSAIPPGQRRQVDVVWFNSVNSYEYDLTSNIVPVGLPRDYTIEINDTRSSTPPVDGWVTVVSVTSNVFKSRQHVIDLNRCNWVRMNVTAVNGGSAVHLCHLDIHDLGQSRSRQPEDSWIHFGDSITLGGLNLSEPPPSPADDASFAMLIHSQLPNRFPAQEDGGMGGIKIGDAVAHIGAWLQNFPGRYVGISYGTNDAGHTSPDDFYTFYAQVVQQVLDAGKVPVIPTIPWGKMPAIQQYVPALNQKIQQLYVQFPEIVPGPDLWSLFQQNPSLIRDNDVHPNFEGFTRMRQWWAQAMIWNVYDLRVASVNGASRDPSIALAPRGPNPATGEIWVDFRLPSGSPASVELFDVMGQRVVSREVGSMGPGPHSVRLAPGRNLAAGLYLVRLRQGAETRTARLTLLR
jgi:hypothetical protein